MSAFTIFVAVLLGVLSCLVVAALLPSRDEKDNPPEGSLVFGTSNRHMKDQYDPKYEEGVALTDSTTSTIARVKALFIYPIKSCAATELQSSEIVPSGLKYDRQYTFAHLKTPIPKQQPDGSYKQEAWWEILTQRDAPRLALLKVQLWILDPSSALYSTEAEYVKNDGCIAVSFKFEPDIDWMSLQSIKAYIKTWRAGFNETIHIPLNPCAERIKAKGYPIEYMKIWKDWPQVFNMGVEIPQEKWDKLKYFLGISNQMTLFRIDDNNLREVFRCAPTKEEVGYQPVVGLADAYPIHMMNLASARDLCLRLPKEHQRDFDAIRFRSNIYMTGPTAYDEDTWKLVRIGSHKYHVSCHTIRCKLPNVNPKTGIADRNQPYTTMDKYRRIDAGAPNMPALGLQLTPMEREGKGVVSVGDEIEILETGDHFYIPALTAPLPRPGKTE